MRLSYTRAFVSAVFFSFGFLLLVVSFTSQTFSQATASDDFYVVDTPQFINTYENDENFSGSYSWTLVTAASYGYASPLCQTGIGCCNYCTYYNPIAPTFALDTFQYRYDVCCLGTGSASNTANVYVIVIPGGGTTKMPVAPVRPQG